MGSWVALAVGSPVGSRAVWAATEQVRRTDLPSSDARPGVAEITACEIQLRERWAAWAWAWAATLSDLLRWVAPEEAMLLARVRRASRLSSTTWVSHSLLHRLLFIRSRLPPPPPISSPQLPWSTSNEDLVELFETTGDVVSAEILFDASGRSRGSGIVEFVAVDQATTAIAKVRASCHSCSFVIQYAESGHALPKKRIILPWLVRPLAPCPLPLPPHLKLGV